MIDDILAAYDWFDQPDGSKYVKTHRDAHRSFRSLAVPPRSFLLVSHKVRNNEELWLIHLGRGLGARARSGRRSPCPASWNRLGRWRTASGYCPGKLLASSQEIHKDTPFAFGTNVCASAFSYEEYAISRREDLLRDFPDHAALIIRLTRDD